MRFVRRTIRAVIALAVLAGFGFAAGCGGGGEVDPPAPPVCAYECCIDANCPSGNSCYQNACFPSLNKTYGLAQDFEKFEDAIGASDGGFFLVGVSDNATFSNQQAFAVKISATGAEEWKKSYGGTSYDNFFDAVQAADGSFIAVGTTNSYNQYYKYDTLLMKFDGSGLPVKMVVHYQYPFDFGDERLFSIDKTQDGGYVAAGYTTSFGYGQEDGLVLKYSSEFAIDENKSGTYGDIHSQSFESVRQTSDGGYIFGGKSDGKAWILKTKVNGDEEWEQIIGGTDDKIYDVIQLFSGGYVAVGSTTHYARSAFSDFLIVRLDKDGNILWISTYGSSYLDEASGVTETFDHGFVVAGTSYPGTTPLFTDISLIKLDRNGNKVWIKRYGTDYHDSANIVIETPDKGLAVAGFRYLLSSSAVCDAWFLKTDPDGNVRDLAPRADALSLKQNITGAAVRAVSVSRRAPLR